MEGSYENHFFRTFTPEEVVQEAEKKLKKKNEEEEKLKSEQKAKEKSKLDLEIEEKSKIFK